MAVYSWLSRSTMAAGGSADDMLVKPTMSEKKMVTAGKDSGGTERPCKQHRHTHTCTHRYISKQTVAIGSKDSEDKKES